MAVLVVPCPGCQTTLKAPENMVGKKAKCKKCGGRLEKMISQTAFQFKGEGWYVTDYGRKGSVSEKVEKELSSPEPAAKSDDGKSKKSPAKKTGPDKS